MRLIKTTAMLKDVYVTKDSWDRFMSEGQAYSILRSKFHAGRGTYVKLRVVEVTELKV